MVSPWGNACFESDGDLSIISTLSEEAGIELSPVAEPVPPPVVGKVIVMSNLLKAKARNRKIHLDLCMRPEAARVHLNSGPFERIFAKYAKIDETQFVINGGGWFAPGAYACVLLFAAAALVGVDVSEEQREYLRSKYKECGLMKGQMQQIEQALAEYENGKPYVLVEPDRSELIKEIETRRSTPGETVAASHFGERFFEEGKGMPDAGGMMLKDSKGSLCAVCMEGKRGKDGDGDGEKPLKVCAKCKRVSYCSRKCQRIDFKHHKKVCDKLAAGEAKPQDRVNFMEMMVMDTLTTIFGQLHGRLSDEDKKGLKEEAGGEKRAKADTALASVVKQTAEDLKD